MLVDRWVQKCLCFDHIPFHLRRIQSFLKILKNTLQVKSINEVLRKIGVFVQEKNLACCYFFKHPVNYSSWTVNIKSFFLHKIWENYEAVHYPLSISKNKTNQRAKKGPILNHFRVYFDTWSMLFSRETVQYFDGLIIELLMIMEETRNEITVELASRTWPKFFWNCFNSPYVIIYSDKYLKVLRSFQF